MQWLTKIADELIERHPSGEILIESGGSPSGTYHLGHMRELITCDAIMLELRKRGRQARHIYYVDDLDAFRKVPKNIPADFEKYLGMPLCDAPAPDGSDASYADYFLQGLIDSCAALSIDVDFIRTHTNYRTGFFTTAIERCLANVPQIKDILESVSNRKLPDTWTPIQVMEQGRLKNRAFVSINPDAKTLKYIDGSSAEQEVSYDKGEVKLDWRLDWPARWWLLDVHVEPFGREHASAGGSYDTGVELMKHIYKADPPIPVAYESIHMVGDTKKMSASKGTAISASEGLLIVPSEVLRYFVLRAPLNRLLSFDPVDGVVKLMDEFAALAAKEDRSESEDQLLHICTRGIDHKTVSRVPFSLLVNSYQAALKDVETTLAIIGRTEYTKVALEDADIIRSELKFIDEWLRLHAPEDVKFKLKDSIELDNFTDQEITYLKALGEKVANASEDADGAWFHTAIYEFKDSLDMQPKDLFTTLYKAIIGKTSGPRAGWFLSILPREWLIQRLRLEK